MSVTSPSAAAGRATTFFEANMRMYRRAWRATIMVAFITPLLFLLSVGVLLGDLVDDANADLGGLTYLEFVAPGLLATMAMQVAANESSFPVMAGIKWSRTYHAVVATPMSVAELLAGVLAWVGARVLVAGAVFTSVAAAIGGFDEWTSLLAPLAALLCGLAFGALICALSTSIENEALLTAVFRFVLLPLFLFSGTFFPVDRLPVWLEPVAWATPLWHGVELCRGLAHGGLETGMTLLHVGYLVVTIALGVAIALRGLRKKLLK